MASGNYSSTSLGQDAGVTIDGDGFAFVDQRERVTKVGEGVAETGRNRATGNDSVNDADTDQNSGLFATGGDGTGTATAVAVNTGPFGTATATAVGIGIGGDADIDARDVVAAGFADTSNASDGSAGITTGSATAYGNYATTAADQTAPIVIGDDGFAFVDQTARISNDGDADASSGRNRATGNDSVNDADTDQDTGLFANGGDGTGTGTAVAVNTGAFGTATATGVGIGVGGDATAEADDVTAAGFADTSNTSDGSASISTGSATAYGNYASTTVNDGQLADVAIGGDGFTFIDQSVRVTNEGEGEADSGRNRATGNASDNDADTDQNTGLFANGGDGTGTGTAVAVNTGAFGTATATGVGIGVGGDATTTADDVVATSFATTSNDSDGSADITTGATTAYGNYAQTAVDQSANVVIDGDGFAFVDQAARITNEGDADASSGRNRATGNDSDNDADTDQDTGLFANGGDGTGAGTAVATNTGAFGTATAVGIGAGTGGDATTTADDVVATSFADTSNTSDGSAGITTGSATAYGNYASTTVNDGQQANVTIDGDGFTFIDQNARVTNEGDGDATTGGNEATGNNSDNDSDTDQATGLFANGGDGTGAATAVAVNTAPFGVATAVAISIGTGGDADVEADDVTAAAFADTTTDSDGSASIVTGAATAYGNVSDTAIDQVANVDIIDDGLSFIDQQARVTNEGEGEASTGNNDAVGNNSDNDSDNDQVNGLFAEAGDGTASSTAVAVNTGAFGTATAVAVAIAVGGDATITADDAVFSNIADTGASSDGSASVETGAALARGNYSATNVVQSVNDPAVLEFTDQAITIANEGDADADSGNNDASGNESDNDVTNDQQVGTFATGGDANATAVAVAPGGTVITVVIVIAGTETLDVDGDNILSNIADTANDSDGNSSILTGAAESFGNVAANSACSGVNVDVDCPVATLPAIVTPPPAPPCPCKHEHVTPPVPPVVSPPSVPNVTEQLPVTGGPLAAQAAFGLLLVALGALLRRRKASVA
jgi:hypothetical protein